MKFLRKKWKKTLLLISFLKFIFYSKKRLDGITHFFFFPFYHMGGAEKVHADILKAASSFKICVFITNVSVDKSFYEEFRKATPFVFTIGSVHYNKIFKQPLLKKIASLINSQNKSVAFSCNSEFFYDLIPHLKEEVKCIDLIHALVHKGETGPEYWSLPYLNRINKRVFISRKGIEDIRAFYLENNVPVSEMDKVNYIPNMTPMGYKKEFKNIDEKLKILYVGRGSNEKRLHLFAQIAKACHELKIPSEFILIGDVINSISKEYHSYLVFKGQINDFNQLTSYYQSADLLLITSSREGFPMAIMEGMAWGVVPISTEVGDIAYHIKNDQNGIIIKNDTEETIINDFTQAIKKLHEDRQLLAHLSSEAYNYAATTFSSDKFNKSYQELLN